jgi:hypothetical protein
MALARHEHQLILVHRSSSSVRALELAVGFTDLHIYIRSRTAVLVSLNLND